MDFYGLSLDPNQMFKIGKKNYHLANNAIRGLIEESDDAKHNIFHAGVNVFVPCIQAESRVKLRISHTGRPLLTPQISSKFLFPNFTLNVFCGLLFNNVQAKYLCQEASYIQITV